MIETFLIVGIDADYNFDASVNSDGFLLPEDLLDVRRQKQALFTAKIHSADRGDEAGRSVPSVLNVEIWQVSGCAPVVALKLQSENRLLPDSSSRPQALTADRASQLVQDILNEVDVHIAERTVEDLFAGQFLPFQVSRDDVAGSKRDLGDVGLHSLFVLTSSDGTGQIACVASTGSAMTKESEYLSALVMVGVRTQRVRLSRKSALWVNGPSDGTDDMIDTWHRSGTQLLQDSGLAAISSRTLMSNTAAWGEEVKREVKLSSELLQDVSMLVPSLQQARYQERMGTLESQKFEKREVEKREDQRYREEEIRRQVAKADSTKLREKQEKTRRDLVIVGSIMASVIAVFALVPAIGALPEKYENAFFGPAWAWIVAALGVVPLVIAGIVVVALIFAGEKLKDQLRRMGGFVRRRFRSNHSQVEEVSPSESVLPAQGGASARQGMASPSQREHDVEVSAETASLRETLSGAGPSPAADSTRADETSTAVIPLSEGAATSGPVDGSADGVEPDAEASQSRDGDMSIPTNQLTLEAVKSDKHSYTISTRAGSSATGIDLGDGGMRVLQGALARREALPSTTEPIMELRSSMMAKGCLVPSDRDGLLLLTQDYDFLSFSQAAGVILGRSTIGAKEWNETMPNDEPDSLRGSTPLESGTASIFCLKSGNSLVSAKGIYDATAKTMTVLKGSTTRPVVAPSLQQNYRELRGRLLASGMLQNTSAGSLELLDDHEFQNPTAAASVFLGRGASGKAFWEHEITQEPLGEYQARMDSVAVSNMNHQAMPVLETTSEKDSEIWELSGPDEVSAQGARREGSRFVVFAGSQARLEEKNSVPRRNKALRRQLVEKSLFKKNGGHYMLTADIEFDSPSQAAGVLLGRSSNGLLEWKNASGELGDALDREAELLLEA